MKLLLSYLLWAGLGLGARPHAFGQVLPSQIELANTDDQVEHLIRAADEYYANFTVNSALKFEDKRVEKQYRRTHVKAWEKADLDGNGFIDLLVTGAHHEGKCKVLCLMDMGAGKLVLEPFDRQFYRTCPIARIVYSGAQPLISYADFAKPFLNEKLKNKQAFRLIYKYGGFVEYNPLANGNTQPDSIVYESVFAYHEVVEKRLTLDAAGNATYHSCTYPVLDEAKKTYVSQKATVAAPALAEIQGMATYLIGQPLQHEYRIGFNHVPRTTLNITYRDGQQIRVRDDGEIGTFGLMQLYKLLGQLRKSHAWQPTKP